MANSYTAGPLVLVRTAGLPTSEIGRLRFDKTAVAVAELARGHLWSTAEGNELSDLLHECIGHIESGPLKGRLVALRRAVFQGRIPGDGEWNDTIAAVTTRKLEQRLRRWIDHRRGLVDDGVRLGSVFEGELSEKRAELRRAASGPLFRHALLQSSKALARELDKWLADENRAPKPAAQVRLARYLSRAVAKTSPYSTYMASGYGSWHQGGADLWTGSDSSSVTVLELDRVLLAHIAETVVHHWNLRSLLPVRVSPGVLEREGKLHFLGKGDHEPIVTVPAGPALHECLRILRGADDLSLGELKTELEKISGGSDVGKFLDQLADRGLLEIMPPMSSESTTPLQEFAEWLGNAGHSDELTPVIGALNRLQAALGRQVSAVEVGPHDARLQDAYRASSELDSLLGSPNADNTDDQRHKFIVHENWVRAESVAQLSASRWQPALTDLDVTCRWLTVFDEALPLRLILGGFCRERFGSGGQVPFLVFHQAVQRAIASPSGSAYSEALAEFSEVWQARPTSLDEHGRAVPRLGELAALRRRARQILSVDAGGDVKLDPARLERDMADWPSWLRPARSVSCYAQMTDPAGELGLVLNTVAQGHGRERARLARLIAAGNRAPAPEFTAMPRYADTVVAELSGVFGTALNLRWPITAYEIDYPESDTRRPDTERIPLSDVYVEHVPETDSVRLRSLRLGHEVQPAHLGMMVDLLLPPAARLLVHGFGTTYLLHPQRRLPAATPAGSEEIVRQPRLRIGRVTVQRARWVAPAHLLPLIGPGEHEAEYLLRVHIWLRRNGIPRQTFVKVIDPALSAADRAFSKNRKPLFVDFDNWFLTMSFNHLFSKESSAAFAVFEEALPSLDEAALVNDGAKHVTEFVLELSTGKWD